MFHLPGHNSQIGVLKVERTRSSGDRLCQALPGFVVTVLSFHLFIIFYLLSLLLWLWFILLWCGLASFNRDRSHFRKKMLRPRRAILGRAVWSSTPWPRLRPWARRYDSTAFWFSNRDDFNLKNVWEIIEPFGKWACFACGRVSALAILLFHSPLT